MTSIEKAIYKANRSRGSICWDCRKAVRKCPWSKKFEPVEGWTAIRRDVLIAGKRRAESYFVLACPEYVPDEVTDETN